jgi:hypothetical protein
MIVNIHDFRLNSAMSFSFPPEPSVTASMIVKPDDFRLNSAMTISFSSNQASARIQPVQFFRPEYNLEIVVQQKLTLLAVRDVTQ